jgi:outer membrane lipoprotein SlyB
MARLRGIVLSATALALLAGCATRPLGPTVAVMPGANKNFDQFAQEQSVCKGYADQQVGGQPQQANNQAVGGAILGTALGAGLGAAAGGGVGAAIGAASGAVVGTGLGAGYSNASGYEIQRQYNIAYGQCMAAHGNQAPTQQAAYNPPRPYYAGYGYPYGYPYACYPYYAGYGPYFGGAAFGWGGRWGWGWGGRWGGWHRW